MAYRLAREIVPAGKCHFETTICLQPIGECLGADMFAVVVGKNMGRLATDLTPFWEAATRPNARVWARSSVSHTAGFPQPSGERLLYFVAAPML